MGGIRNNFPTVKLFCCKNITLKLTKFIGMNCYPCWYVIRRWIYSQIKKINNCHNLNEGIIFSFQSMFNLSAMGCYDTILMLKKRDKGSILWWAFLRSPPFSLQFTKLHQQAVGLDGLCWEPGQITYIAGDLTGTCGGSSWIRWASPKHFSQKLPCSVKSWEASTSKELPWSNIH